MIIITAITTLFSVINKFYCSLRCFYDVVIFYRLCFLKRKLSRDFFHVFFFMIWTHLPIFNYCFDFVDIFAYVQKLRGVNDTVNPNVFCNFSKFSSSIKRGCFTKFSTLFFHGSNSFVPKIYAADRFVAWKTFCLLFFTFFSFYFLASNSALRTPIQKRESKAARMGQKQS